MKKNMMQLCDELKPLEVDFKGNVDEIRGEIKAFEAALAEKENANRDLTIAIVGRVKSGKSSFLNALLFDGESVLPQAATPMTAALTFIEYDATCHAKVDFFTSEEWKTFKIQSAQYDEIVERVRKELEDEEAKAEKKAKQFFRPYVRREITDQLVAQRAAGELNENQIAAHELVSMAARTGFDVTSCLGTSQEISGASSPAELAGKLQDYVGANGRYTPIVCSTTIYLNDSNLKGYRVVDTPGTNDPIISRGKKTNDNLKKSDVVLAMSPAGRFFDNADLSLFGQNLPASGIKDFMLLASQYDLAVGNVANEVDRSLPPLKRLIQAMGRVQRQITESYRQRISEIAKQAMANGAEDAEKWDMLLGVSPQCVSAQAFILAKHWDSLTEKEREQMEVFNTRVPGYVFDRKILNDFSMMDKVHGKVEEVKAKKAEILEKGKTELADAASKKISALVKGFADFVKAKIESLETSDVASLQKMLKEQTKALEKGRTSLEDVFEQAIVDAHNKFTDILNDVREARETYSHLEVQTETRSKEYEHDKGCGFLGWRSLFGCRYETRTRTVTTRYAEAYQAVDQVDGFATKARTMLERGIRDAVDVRAIQSRIADAALAIFEDAPSDDFDVDLLKAQILKAVRMLTIPDADFGDVDYSQVITSRFSGERVTGDKIDQLRAAQREALHDVIKDLEKRAKGKAASIEKSLKEAMASFVDKLIGDLKADCEQTSASLEDKETNLARWKGYLPILQNVQNSIK